MKIWQWQSKGRWKTPDNNPLHLTGINISSFPYSCTERAFFTIQDQHSSLSSLKKITYQGTTSTLRGQFAFICFVSIWNKYPYQKNLIWYKCRKTDAPMKTVICWSQNWSVCFLWCMTLGVSWDLQLFYHHPMNQNIWTNKGKKATRQLHPI